MLTENTGGSIVNVTAAQVNHPIERTNSSVVMMINAGWEAVTRSLAMEYAKQGIRANAVAPGVVDTPMHEGQSEGLRKTLQPMGQMSGAKDIVDAIRLSDGSRSSDRGGAARGWRCARRQVVIGSPP